MNKIRHSKLKNTGIIFELLIRQVSSDIYKGKDSPAIDIIKKYYNKTELSKEHKLYQSIISNNIVENNKAESLINTVIDLSKRLNKSTLRNLKYNLIKEIKDNYNIDEFFQYKLENYKQLAAIYTLIENNSTSSFISPDQIIDNKNILLEYIENKNKPKSIDKDPLIEEFSSFDSGTRILAYKILVNKFNKKYTNLLPEQKQVLKEYINNLDNNIINREKINSHYLYIKKQIKENINKIPDKVTRIKIKEVYNLLKPINKTYKVTDNDILGLLQYYELINEINNND